MKLRKLAASLVSAIILLTMFTPLCKSKVIAASGDFLPANEAVAEIGVGWNLGNTLDSYGTWISGTNPSSFETAWGNPETTEAMIDSVKNQGFNAIRIPVTWSQHIDDNGNIDSSWMSRVKTVVDYAYNKGMIVILNVHHDTGEIGGDKVSWIFAMNDNFSSNQAKYASLWTNIANEFKDYDGRLLFEGYNEMLDTANSWNVPTEPSSYEAVNNYAQTFVDTVRATGGNNSERNLIVTTYVASVDPGALDNFVVPNDSANNHLIAEVHVYAPWGFTGTAAAVTWTSTHSTFGDSDRSEIDDILNRLSNFSSRTGLPVIIGECGAEYKSNNSERAAYASYLISKAAEKNIKCFWWDNGDFNTGSTEGGYGIFNRVSGEWITEIVEALVEASTSTAVENNNPSEETEATESSETEATSEETEETTVATSEAETEETFETTAEETLETEALISDETPSVEDSSNVKSSRLPIYIGVGVLIILASYVGLFFLGRKNSNK